MELFEKLGINGGLMIAQIVNFAILVGILSAFVYKPVLRLLDERTARIRKAMDDAARVEHETKMAEQTRQDRLRSIDDEAGRLLAEAKERTQVIEKELIEKAQRDAEQILERGRRQLAEERKAALDELQDILGKAIVRVSQTVLEREFSKADQERILQSAAQQIPSMLR